MNILLLLAHSIAEHDDLRMLTDLGYDVFSIGAYTDPRNPSDDKRPALPGAPWHPDLAALVAGDQLRHKEHLPAELIEWADVIIAHHYVREWLLGQWSRIRPRGGKRVIWRTCGQSDVPLEQAMAPLRSDGLEVVRYSPAERRFFEPLGVFAGQDALIRFGKYVDDYGPWEPDPLGGVINVTQDMAGRGDWCGLTFWHLATAGLESEHGMPVRPAGPGSEKLPGGLGMLAPDAMRDYLRTGQAYLYTGTMPASYTLGLIEALLSGVPTISIGAEAWMGPDALFEAPDLIASPAAAYDNPALANLVLRNIQDDPAMARDLSIAGLERARRLFDVRDVGRQWVDLLGAP